MNRNQDCSGPYTVGTTESASAKIPYGSSAGGFVTVAAAHGMTTLTYWVSYDRDGADSTFVALYSRANAAVTQSLQSGASAYPIPDECYGAAYFKVTGGAAGTVRVITKT